MYRNDLKRIIDHILVGGFGFSRDLTDFEINGLREKMGSLIRQAGELENMAMSGVDLKNSSLSSSDKPNGIFIYLFRMSFNFFLFTKSFTV